MKSITVIYITLHLLFIPCMGSCDPFDPSCSSRGACGHEIIAKVSVHLVSKSSKTTLRQQNMKSITVIDMTLQL